MSQDKNQRLLDAQVGVIGSMLIDADCVGHVLSATKTSQFVSATYRTIYQAIKSLFSESRPVDPVTVRDRLQQAAGADYEKTLLEIMELTPTSANVDAYIEILRKDAIVWHLQQLGNQLASTDDVDAALALLDKANAAASDKGGVEVWDMMQMWEDFSQRHSSQQPKEYLKWGLKPVDERVYAEAGDFIILGGYSSDGKTCLALSMAMTMAKTHKVGFFSCETDKSKLGDRIMTAKAMVDFGKIKKNQLNEQAWEELAYAASALSQTGLHIIQSSGFSPSDIQAVALAHHFDIVFVDYLQILRASNKGRGWSRPEEVGEISRELQTLAHSKGITVVALSQLTPGENRKKNEAPTMYDLRESKQLVQDADVVFLLYKEEAEVRNSRRILKCDKNKDGEAGWYTKLAFAGQYQTFSPSAEGAGAYQRKKDDENQMRFTEIPDEPDPWHR